MHNIEEIELAIDTPEVFLPLLQEDKRYRVAWGGRGSGKSHFFAELLVERMLIDPKMRVVCVREVQKSLKESAYRLICDKIDRLGVTKYFRIMNDRIATHDGGMVIFQGMQDHTAESIKSLEGFSVAWCEESQSMSERSLELLRPTIRMKGSEIWFSFNPNNQADPVSKLFQGENVPDNAVVVRANYSDNPWFPDELRGEMEFDKRSKPDRFSHIWLGDFQPQAVGAIWNRQGILDCRVHEAPTMERIVVSVDPAVSNEEHSDKHGVIVAGLGENKNGYILDDLSLKGSPQQWAERAIAAYDKWEADAVVVEINQGGDMVKHTLRTVRPNIRIVEVRATRGKHVRAEPISALYALGQIHHVGTFPDLESEMCLMTSQGYEGTGSPDRVDAMVWAFTELFPKIVNRAKKKTVKVNIPQQGGWMN